MNNYDSKQKHYAHYNQVSQPVDKPKKLDSFYKPEPVNTYTY